MNGAMLAGIISGPAQIHTTKIPIPDVAPDGVLLKVNVCGICGTDLHFYSDGRATGRPIGHEIAGQVVEVGSRVSGFKLGDRAAVEISVYCGRCRYCLAGDYNLCREYGWIGGTLPGANAEYVAVPAYTLHRLPGAMPDEQGALIEPVAVAVHAVAPSGIGPGSSVAILGSGTIGLTTLMVAKAYGASRTMITARYEHQARLARELGADCVVTPGRESIEDAARRLSDGDGVDVTFNTVRQAEALQDACRITRRKGRIVLLAMPAAEPLTLRFPLEATITSSFIYGSVGLKRDFEIALELVAAGKAPVDRLVSHRFRLGDIEEAYRVAADKRTGAVKVLLEGPS